MSDTNFSRTVSRDSILNIIEFEVKKSFCYLNKTKFLHLPLYEKLTAQEPEVPFIK